MKRATALLLLLTACKSTDHAVMPPPPEPAPAADEAAPPGEPLHGRPSETLYGPTQLDPEYWSVWDIDSIHRQLTQQARSGGAWIDDFLSNERSTAEENQSWFQMETTSFYEEHEGLDQAVRVRANLALPHAEDRLQLALSRLDEDDDAGASAADISQTALPPVRGQQPEGYSVAIKYFLKATERNNIAISGGLDFNGLTPNPYGSVRWRHLEHLGDATDLRITERFRYFLEEGGESRTTIDLEHTLSDTLFARLTTTGNWWQEREGFYYGEYATLYHRVSPERVLSYELGTDFSTEVEGQLAAITARVRARQLFARDWILIEVAPQVAWREDRDFESTLGLLFTLRMTFRQRELIRDPLNP